MAFGLWILATGLGAGSIRRAFGFSARATRSNGGLLLRGVSLSRPGTGFAASLLAPGFGLRIRAPDLGTRSTSRGFGLPRPGAGFVAGLIERGIGHPIRATGLGARSTARGFAWLLRTFRRSFSATAANRGRASFALD